MRIHGVTAIVACLLLAGCATTEVSDLNFPRGDTDLHILGTQQKIEPETNIPKSLSMLGGFAVAVTVYEVKKRRAAESITPIRDELAEHDLGDLFVNRIQTADITGRLVDGTEPVVWDSPEALEDREVKRTTIMIEPRVKLSNDMRTLMVDLEVWEFHPGNRYKLPDRGFSLSYSFLWRLEDADSLDRAEAVAAWLDHPQMELIDVIEMGMDETVQMLETHLHQETLVFDEPDEVVSAPTSGRFYLWQDHEDTSWLSRNSGKGTIYSIPHHVIEEESQSREPRRGRKHKAR